MIDDPSFEQPMVDAQAIELTHPGRTLWKDLSFHVHPGELLVIRGQSGSGKTTLLHCIGSLAKCTAGGISVCGKDVSTLRGARHRRFLRHDVGFVFQNAGLVPAWSVRRNIELAGVTLGPKRSLSAAAAHAFDDFALATELIDVPAYRLSGGEQQRVALIRLALRKPRVLLLDEPSSALDDANTNRLLTFIDRHLDTGGVGVVATHDSRVIERAHRELHL